MTTRFAETFGAFDLILNDALWNVPPPFGDGRCCSDLLTFVAPQLRL